jgi:predicted HicB family RNase H-like nuclease
MTTKAVIQFSLRITHELKAMLRIVARDEEISLSKAAVLLMEMGFAEYALRKVAGKPLPED